MGVRYDVPIRKQLSRMSCVPTAVWMLHRWYLTKIGAVNGTPMFDNMVNVSQVQYGNFQRQLTTAIREKTATADERLDGGLSESDIAAFVHRCGMRSESISMTEQSFDSQLSNNGPFIYIERLPHDRLPLLQMLNGQSNSQTNAHATVIVGIEKIRGFTLLSYNDPATGHRERMDFYKFILQEHRPLRGIDKSLIMFFG